MTDVIANSVFGAGIVSVTPGHIGAKRRFPMEHKITTRKGTDARNHVAKCACGWAYCNTRKRVLDRISDHMRAFEHEPRAWNDPLRAAVMPMAYPLG